MRKFSKHLSNENGFIKSCGVSCLKSRRNGNIRMPIRLVKRVFDTANMRRPKGMAMWNGCLMILGPESG